MILFFLSIEFHPVVNNLGIFAQSTINSVVENLVVELRLLVTHYVAEIGRSRGVGLLHVLDDECRSVSSNRLGSGVGIHAG